MFELIFRSFLTFDCRLCYLGEIWADWDVFWNSRWDTREIMWSFAQEKHQRSSKQLRYYLKTAVFLHDCMSVSWWDDVVWPRFLCLPKIPWQGNSSLRKRADRLSADVQTRQILSAGPSSIFWHASECDSMWRIRN